MTFSPRQIDQMSVWEFGACADGFAILHGAKSKGRDIDEIELAEMGIVGF